MLSKRNIINKFIIISAVLFLHAYFESKAFSGECLEPNEDRYQALFDSYRQFEAGKHVEDFPFVGSHCWRTNNELDSKLHNLLEEMISDQRLSQKSTDGAVSSYLELYGPTAFIEPYIEKSTGKAREELISMLLYLQYPSTFDSTAFFKRQISKESNPELKQRMVERLANNYGDQFSEFETYCRQNNIEITPHVLVRFSDLQALKYLIEHKNLISVGFQPPYDYASSYSDFVFKVLARHLETIFPPQYLEFLDSKDLRLLKNGIYATYGKNFKSKNLQYYYYGDYPYVQCFCRKGVCGLTKNKGTYSDADLTNTDKINLGSISTIEAKRSSRGEKNQQLLVENYNFKAFTNGIKDNFTFSSPEIQKIKHIKVDWNRHEIFIWDKFGVSAWNFLTGKRFKFIKKAEGPIGLAPEKRLLAYQLKGNLVIESIDSGTIVYQAKIMRPSSGSWINTINYFTKDGRYFLFQVERSKMGIFNTSTNLKSEVDLVGDNQGMGQEFFCSDYHTSSIFLTNEPIVVTDDNKLIGILHNKWITLSLDDPSKVRFLNYNLDAFNKNNNRYWAFCSIALSPDGKHIYGDPGFQAPIARFKVDQIITAKDKFPDPDLFIMPGVLDLRYIGTLEIVDNLLFRGDHSYLGWIDLNHIEKQETKRFDNIYGLTADFSIKDRMLAIGNERGFVVFKRFPTKDSAH